MSKNIILSIALFLVVITAQAQTFRGLDKSPRDISYFPDNFAHDRKDGEKPLAKVSYSRPYANDREIFGELVPFGKVSRAGADEATEITFFTDAKLGGKAVKAGTYSLYTIPDKTEWTIILNKDLDFWGAYKYRESEDVLRVTVPVKSDSNEYAENFSIQFFSTGTKAADLMIGWANTVVAVPVTFK
ncbi:DUF2911 domain-containing protein [Dyadobacter tibetensis]|uniref:DUF2911 domain-containing protein n=1 Tax=Dyadobacter tibetensis TaxID=1211851 RepID=UPI000472AD8A|nr:DUF2911 domain-containing protein [Dyadobacter tibetensis]